MLITRAEVFFQGSFKGVRDIEKNAWVFLLAAGIFTSFLTLLSYKALSIGHASSVATVERSSLVLAIIPSIIFLKEKENLADIGRRIGNDRRSRANPAFSIQGSIARQSKTKLPHEIIAPLSTPVAESIVMQLDEIYYLIIVEGKTFNSSSCAGIGEHK